MTGARRVGVDHRRRPLSTGLLAVLLLIGACTASPADGTAARPDAPTPPAPAAPPPLPEPVPEPLPDPPAPEPSPEEPTDPGIDLSAHSTTDPDSPWVLVTPDVPIDPLDHRPDDLVVVGDHLVREVIADDLEALVAAAREDGVRLPVISGFRSYAAQERAHATAVARNGREIGTRLSARPGHSEHQTGLAVDFGSTTRPGCDLKQSCYHETVEAVWLAEHAAAFGFVLRYGEGDEEVTGYLPEAWHFRWVGRELAGWMAQEGVTTLEEVFDVPPLRDDG